MTVSELYAALEEATSYGHDAIVSADITWSGKLKSITITASDS